MIILGLESSCDETACGIVEDGLHCRAHVVASQLKHHQPFGGVVPEIAARAHLQNIDAIVEEALAQANIGNLSDIDAISCTQGPGLIGALLVGTSYAKGLATASAKPLIPVNHIHAHLYGAVIDQFPSIEEVQALFPALALIVSGGHTNLYYMPNVWQFELLSYSLDDACGECFDKVGKLLGLSYPAGPKIETLAQKGNPQAFSMPKMMSKQNDLFFSYAGLKTYMARLIDQFKDNEIDQRIADLCASFQHEALSQIVRKLKQAYILRPQARSCIIAGGVSANQYFRNLCQQQLDSLSFFFPRLTYCSDNGAMIAACAYFDWTKNPTKAYEYFRWNRAWDAFSRYPFEDYLSYAPQ